MQSQVSSSLNPATIEVIDRKNFLIGQIARKDAARPQGRQTHNQPQKKQETHNQARTRAVTLRAASPVLLMQSSTRFCCCCYSKGNKRSSKTRDASKLSHTLRSHTLACSRPSRHHHHTPPQKNSAFMLISSRGRPSEGGVLSRGRPSPKAGVSSMAKERGGRKMITSWNVRAKRAFYTCLAAPYRCLNRPRLRFDWRSSKRGEQPGTRTRASHTASTSLAYGVLPWGELT